MFVKKSMFLQVKKRNRCNIQNSNPEKYFQIVMATSMIDKFVN